MCPLKHIRKSWWIMPYMTSLQWWKAESFSSNDQEQVKDAHSHHFYATQYWIFWARAVRQEKKKRHPKWKERSKTVHPYFIAALFTIAKFWEKPKCTSVNEWIKKLWYIYTMAYYAAERKKELVPFVRAWMELENIMLSEISQSVKDKYHVISSIRGS